MCALRIVSERTMIEEELLQLTSLSMYSTVCAEAIKKYVLINTSTVYLFLPLHNFIAYSSFYCYITYVFTYPFLLWCSLP